MAKNLNTLVSVALNAAAAYGSAVSTIRDAVKATLGKNMDAKAVRIELLPAVATHYGVGLTAGERGVKMDDKAKGYEAAKKALQRMTKDVMGVSKGHTDTLEVPAELLAAAAKLVKLAAQYEQAGKLIATAIAQAKAE